MTRFAARFAARFAVGLAAGLAVVLTVASGAPARAQGADAGAGRSPNFLENLFGRERRANSRAPGEQDDVQVAQVSSADLVVRLERMEAQIRQLTGAVEQLQYRNQQLELQLRRGGEEGERITDPRAGARMPPVAAAPPPPPPPPPAGGRRSDAFDPAQNPGAPGVPRPLLNPGAQGSRAIVEDEPRATGTPLDLSTLSGRAAAEAPAGLPPPPPRNPNATGAPPQQMVMAPSNTPKDEFDLAYGYILRKDYALAEDSLRAFLEKYPGDRMAADANYWLGESMFQRQRYRDAAEIFLTVSTKYPTLGKAPDALLRLGQSLVALKEKDAACGTFAEIGRKYPRASPTVRQTAERDAKRAGC